MPNAWVTISLQLYKIWFIILCSAQSRFTLIDQSYKSRLEEPEGETDALYAMCRQWYDECVMELLPDCVIPTGAKKVHLIEM